MSTGLVRGSRGIGIGVERIGKEYEGGSRIGIVGNPQGGGGGDRGNYHVEETIRACLWWWPINCGERVWLIGCGSPDVYGWLLRGGR